jgi:hypothetical protein
MGSRHERFWRCAINVIVALILVGFNLEALCLEVEICSKEGYLEKESEHDQENQALRESRTWRTLARPVFPLQWWA